MDCVTHTGRRSIELQYNVSDVVTCATDSACSCALCHSCLVTCFSQPWRSVGGELIHFNPTQCPTCREEGAFSLDESDAATVSREIAEMCADDDDAGTVGTSYSTSHDQGD